MDVITAHSIRNLHQYVGVVGGTIEIQIPLSMVGNPTVFYGIQVEVNNCCVPDYMVLDYARLGGTFVFIPPLVWAPSGLTTPGNSWIIDAPPMGGMMYFTLEAVNETVQVPAGTFNECARISLVIISQEGDTVQTGDYTYAPGVGEVRNTGWNQNMGNYNLKLTEYWVQATTTLAVETQVDTAVAGSNLVIGASLSRTITPTLRRLYYRKGGETAFKSIDMIPDGADYTATIPGADVTIRGLEYYVRFSDGQTEATYPPFQYSEEPASIQVRVGNMEAPLDIVPLKYQMISVPLILTDPSVQAVLIDDYGEYDDNVWRLSIYQDTDTSYFLEYPDFSRTFTPGSAFWFISRTGDSFDIEGGLSVPTDEPMEFMFYPGWNQVANPVAFPLLVDTTGEEMYMELPVFYNGDDYEYNVMSIQPWTGVFVKNNGTQPMPHYVNLKAAHAPIQVPLLKKLLRSPDDYIVQLKVSTEGFDLIDTQNYLGFLEDAQDGRDRRDISEAPPIGDHIRFSIIENGERMAGSFKPLNALGHEWDIDLTCTVRADVQTIVTLEESGQRPDSMDIHILDMDDRSAIPVTDHTFQILLKKDSPARHLKVIVGTEDYAGRESEGISLHPEYFTLYQNYPNPFNMETVLPYDIWNRGWVRIDIYSITGQRICPLVAKMQDPGRYIERWNGTDRFGRPMPGGVYFCRIRMDALTETKKLILLR